MTDVRKNDLRQQLLQAVTALGPFKGRTFVVDGKVVKCVDLTALFQGQITAMATTDTSRATWLKDAGIQKAGDAPVKAALKALQKAIAMQYGTASEEYVSFGFPVPQPRAKPTTPTRSAAVAQSQATRKARNTMGKKQRLAIKGVVQPVTSAPVAPSSSAPSTPTTASSGTSPNGVNGASK